MWTKLKPSRRDRLTVTIRCFDAAGASSVETGVTSGVDSGVVLGNDAPSCSICPGQGPNEPPLSEPDCISVQASIPISGYGGRARLAA